MCEVVSNDAIMNNEIQQTIQLQVSIHSYWTFKGTVHKTPDKKNPKDDYDCSSLSSISDHSS